MVTVVDGKKYEYFEITGSKIKLVFIVFSN